MEFQKGDPTSFPLGCFLPLNAIAVHPQGYPHFCLTSTLQHQGGLKDFAAKRNEIHQQLLAGQWPKTCLRCKNKEDRNLQSRRTRTWERKVDMYGPELAKEYVQTTLAPTIRHLEISFSNLCNISCVMCSSEFSSTWFAHDRRAMQEGLEFRNFTGPAQQLRRISPELLGEILGHVQDFDLIIIKGGEPTREPSCLNFLKQLNQSARKKMNLSVFLQSNGTRAPEEWLPGLENLNFEMGFSMDGWGEVFRWVRGADFEKCLANFLSTQKVPFVQSVSIDFTLSAYNCFHLPEFFTKLLELKEVSPKLREIPVFQWVQQDYASPLNLRQEDRMRVADELAPILERGKGLFLNGENLLNVLRQPRAQERSLQQARQWYTYLKSMRGWALQDWDQRISESLS
jgi:MoaA/NifB/PqqE/SkfB family radical SAM enzyme